MEVGTVQHFKINGKKFKAVFDSRPFYGFAIYSFAFDRWVYCNFTTTLDEWKAAQRAAGKIER